LSGKRSQRLIVLAKADRFLAINNLSATSRLTTGQKVKLVVYGSRRNS